eukprot:TRINITY_DN37719_c0_g1_i1.p1 TRINITY_DN37719_c0_g1~~TRINITY_DN37719_c0_g1_i1.p1  ORF type:complete len:120 (+),score=27.59 TRINITY_DN37719_c0_g1_i1:188-547(+)
MRINSAIQLLHAAELCEHHGLARVAGAVMTVVWDRVGSMAPTQLAWLTTALAAAGEQSENTVQTVVQECKNKLARFSVAELVDIAWGLNHKWHHLYKAESAAGQGIQELSQLIRQQQSA